MSAGRHHLAVVTGDPLGRRLSGPGIRALELSRVLAREHEVRLVSTKGASLTVPGLRVMAAIDDAAMRELEAWADVIVFQGFLLSEFPFLVDTRDLLVCDAYDPFHLEYLEQSRGRPPEERRRLFAQTNGGLETQLRLADVVLCASAVQRDFWLGELAAIGRVNPRLYEVDPAFDSFVRIVPFGVPEAPPVRGRGALRGVVDGIGPEDRVLLWGGGLYPWFDPGLVVDAVAEVARSVPDVRLVFLGGTHPNPTVPPSATATSVREQAAALGLLGQHVFFIGEWVPYDRRHEYLLDADIGVSAHHDHVETAFSFRTRILDYLWAGLPVVTTAGDAMGDMVAREGAGRAVPAGERGRFAEALVELLTSAEARAACEARSRAVAATLTWPEAARPLLDFCRRPVAAADRPRSGAEGADGPPGGASGASAGSVRRLVDLVRERGPAVAARQVVAGLRRRLNALR